MFCCGCKVTTGGQLVLVCHLFACALIIYSCCESLISQVPTLASVWTPGEQLVSVAFSLMGIPLIIAAMYGIYFRMDINLKLYLYYLLATFVVNLYLLVSDFMLQDPCEKLGSLSGTINDSFGEAFTCGVLRIFCYFFVASMVSLEVYCLWVIWSLIEEMTVGQMGPELASLLPTKGDIVKKLKRPQDGPYADIVGLAHAKVPGPYPSPNGYDTIQTIGMGSQPLFGGNSHDTNFPPSPQY